MDGIDFEGLVWAESEELGATLDELDDAALDHPSLCVGWRVRDVYAHMLLGYTTPLPSMIVMLARYGFNVRRDRRRARLGTRPSTHRRNSAPRGTRWSIAG
jgi:hypothetical protein